MADFFMDANVNRNQDEEQQKRGRSFFDEVNNGINQRRQEYQEDLDRYSVNIPQEDYDVIKTAIANADIPEDESYRWASAMEINRQYNVPVQQAYANLEDFNAAIWGNKYSFTPKTNFKAIVDNGRLGVNTLKQGNLGTRIMLAEAAGEDITELLNEYNAIETENESLYDYMDRNFVIEALKFGAQSLPFTGYVAGAGILGSVLAPGVGTAAAFTASMQNASGLQYMQLRKDGSSKDVALGLSLVDGALEAIVETSLGNVAGAMGRNALAAGTKQAIKEKIVANVFKRLNYGGVMKNIALRLGSEYIKENFEEGMEEVIQDLINKGTSALAAEIGAYDIDPITAESVAKDAWENFYGGLMGSLVLGLPTSALKVRSEAKEYKAVKDAAEIIDSKEMFQDAVKDSPIFEGMKEEEIKEASSTIWEQAAEVRDAKENEEAEAYAEVHQTDDNLVQPTVNDEGEEEIQPVYRDPDTGTLYTQDDIVSDDGDGIVQGSYRFGDPTIKDKNLQGNIDYTSDLNNKTITINNFNVPAGWEAVRGEFYDYFAQDHADWAIKWDPQLEEGKAIKNKLVEANPRGAAEGLNYYGSTGKIEEIQTDKNVVNQIDEAYKKIGKTLSKKQLAAHLVVMKSLFKRLKTDLNAAGVKVDTFQDWINYTFKDGVIFGDPSKMQEQLKQEGQEGVKGFSYARDLKKLNQDIKSLIYITENGDFSTFTHEIAHIAKQQLTGDILRQAEKAFGVEEGATWTEEQDEAFAYGFEQFLRTGKAKNNELKNIFQKIAQFLMDCMEAFKPVIKISPEIESFYNELLSKGDESILRQAMKAAEETEQQNALAAKKAEYDQKNNDNWTVKREEILQEAREKMQDKQNTTPTNRMSLKTVLGLPDSYEKYKVLSHHTMKLGIHGPLWQAAVDELHRMDPMYRDQYYGGMINSLNKESLDNTNLTEEQKQEALDIIDDPNTTIGEKEKAAMNAAAESQDMPIFQKTMTVNNKQLLQAEEVRRRYENTNQWLKAPNGEESKLTEKQWLLVRTENFKKWFGDWENDPVNASKVLGENGEPLVVYHGTRAKKDFYIFNTVNEEDKGNVGAHFGPRETAEGFSTDKIYEVFLNIRKPFRPNFDYFADNYNNAYLEILLQMKKEMVSDRAQNAFNNIYDVYPILQNYDLEELDILEEFDNDDVLEDKSLTRDDYIRVFTDHRNAMVDIMLDMMRAEGYDGMVYENWYEGDYNNLCYVALQPNQIKSATDNIGTYNIDDPDIRFQHEFESEEDREVAITEAKTWIKDNLSEHDSKRILDNMERLRYDEDGNETGYFNMAFESALLRRDIEMIRNGEELADNSWLKQENEKYIERQIEANKKRIAEGKPAKKIQNMVAYQAILDGEEGIIDYLNKREILSNAAKCEKAINGSILNCNPSAACAKYCYVFAKAGHYQGIASVLKSEIVNEYVEEHPIEAARLAARQYVRYKEAGYALRIFDKGDLTEKWLPFLKELNEKHSIRNHVFSKRPNLLSELDPNANRLLLSIDATNKMLANEYPKLDLAAVVGPEDTDILQDFTDRLKVVFVAKGVKGVSPKKTVQTAEQFIDRTKLCPVDAFGAKMTCIQCQASGKVGCWKNNNTKAGLNDLLNKSASDIIKAVKEAGVKLTNGNETFINNHRDDKELIYEYLSSIYPESIERIYQIQFTPSSGGIQQSLRPVGYEYSTAHDGEQPDFGQTTEYDEESEDTDQLRLQKVTTEDLEYAEAVATGNIEKAAALLKEAAKKAFENGATFELADDTGTIAYKIHRGRKPAGEYTKPGRITLDDVKKHNDEHFAVIKWNKEHPEDQKPVPTRFVYKALNFDIGGGSHPTYAGTVDVLPWNYWLDAQAIKPTQSTINGGLYIPGTTGFDAKAYGLPNKSQGGSGKWLSFRPAFHAGDGAFPGQMRVIYRTAVDEYNRLHPESPIVPDETLYNDPDTTKKNYMLPNKLIALVEIPGEKNYQEEAEEYSKVIADRTEKWYDEHPEIKRPKPSKPRPQLPHTPDMGYYEYNNQGEPWVLAGQWKMHRLLTLDEIRQINAADGIQNEGKTQMDWPGGYNLEEYGFDADGNKLDLPQQKLADITYDDNGNLIPLSQRFDPDSSDIRYQKLYAENVSITNIPEYSKEDYARSFTDEELWDKMENERQIVKDDYKRILNDPAFVAMHIIEDDGQEKYIARSPRGDGQGKWQMSLFDKYGPYSHITFDDLEEAYRRSYELPYHPKNIEVMYDAKLKYDKPYFDAIGANDIKAAGNIVAEYFRKVGFEGPVDIEVTDVTDVLLPLTTRVENNWYTQKDFDSEGFEYSMLFQTQEELYDLARSFKTWEEFMDYNEVFADTDEASAVPSNADAQWYQTTWELANGTQPEESLNEKYVQDKLESEGTTPTALDAMFIAEMRDGTNFDDFMHMVARYASIDLNSAEYQNLRTAEDAEEVERIAAIQDLIQITMNSEMDQRAINRIAAGGELDVSFRNKIISEMTDDFKSRNYRELYAEVMDIPSMKAERGNTAADVLQKRYDETAANYPLALPSRIEVSRLSPQRQKELAETISNVEIAEALRNGTLKMDNRIDRYIKALQQQINERDKSIQEMLKQIREETERLTLREQKDLIKMHDELIKAKAAMDKRNKELLRKIEKGLNVTEKYRKESQNLKHDYNEALRKYEDALATAKITGEVQKALDLQNKLGTALENIDELKTEQTSMQEIQKIRKNLVKRTMRRVRFDKVDYDYARQVIAIQRIFQPNLIGGVNKWIGQNTPYLRGVISQVLTDKEYRNDLTNYLWNNSKGSTAYAEFMAKWRELITAPTYEAGMELFKNWDDKTVKRAALYLPKEDWIAELMLKELDKEREESIDLDIELEERREPMKDEKGQIIYQNQYDENGNLIKNPDVQKPYMKTMFGIKASDEILQMVKDAVGEDIYQNLLNRPFSDWTTAEMEKLARRVDDLYNKGRDIFEAKKELRKQNNATLRQRIEDTVNNTGIVINDDDTPEEKERKKKKIDEILGLNSNLKGTNAAESDGLKARMNRLLHSYNDASVLRVARILDGYTDGTNVNLLYRQEDDCYNLKTRSINGRVNAIEKVMSDNGITMSDLARIVEVDGRQYTIDELLFFAAANEDYVNLETSNPESKDLLDNDDFAATSRNAVMFGNMISDTESLQYKQELEKEDEMILARLNDPALSVEERLKLFDQLVETKPGLKKFIAESKRRYAAILEYVEKNMDEKYQKLRDAIAKDYADQYDRMNEISIKEFNTPVHRVKCYVPIIRKESNGADNYNQVKEDLLAAIGSGAGKQWVNKGMTKRRVNMNPFHQKPVQTGLYKTWANSVERTEHFIAYSAYTRQLNDIYKSRDANYVRQYIENRYGRGMLTYIDDYINEVANPNALKVREKGSEILHELRGKTASAYLAWKLSGIVKQAATSPWPFMQFITPKEYLAASWKIFTSRGTLMDAIEGKTGIEKNKAAWKHFFDSNIYQEIRDKSVFMNNRTMDPMADLIDEMAQRADQNKVEKFINDFNKAGMAGLEWIDWACVAPGWYACYLKKHTELEALAANAYEATKQQLTDENDNMEYGMPGWKTSEQIEKLAHQAEEEAAARIEIDSVRYADDCTRACQPSNRTTDIAPLFKQGGEFKKAYLQFQTSLNVIWQNLAYDIKATAKSPDANKQQAMKKIMGIIAGYVLAGIFMNSIMEGYGGDDDDDGTAVDDNLKKLIYYATTQFTDAVPMVGSEITNTMDKVITGKSQYMSSGTDMTPTLTKLTSIITNASKGNFAKAADMTAEGIGMYLGLPVSGTKEIFKLLDIGDGDGEVKLNLGNVYGILDTEEE